jgi:hypothetical protein
MYLEIGYTFISAIFLFKMVNFYKNFFKQEKKDYLVVDFYNKHSKFDISKLNLNKDKLLYYIEYKLNDKYYTFLYNTRIDSYFQFDYGMVEDNKIFKHSIEEIFQEEFVEIFIKELI